MTAAAAGSPARPNLGDDGNRDSGADPHGASIHVTTEGPTVVIVVEGTLDAPQGDRLVRLARAAVAPGPDRLDIDLRTLDDYTEEGAAALVACRALGARLGEGLHYRTGRGPGREALLLAYQDADAPNAPESLGEQG